MGVLFKMGRLGAGDHRRERVLFQRLPQCVIFFLFRISRDDFCLSARRDEREGGACDDLCIRNGNA